MKVHKNQNGIAIFETILLVAIVAIIGFAGYKVFSTKKAVEESSANISASQPTGTLKTTPSYIKTTSDLNKTEQAVDNMNADDTGAELNQLDSQLNAF